MAELNRSSSDDLLAELDAAGAVRRGTSIKCPFHEDDHPSGSVYEKDGIWRFKCHACGWCGDRYDVKAKATGRPLEDVLKEAAGTPVSAPRMAPPPPTAPPASPKRFDSIEAYEQSLGSQHVATYSYTNPETHDPDLIVFRWTGQNGAKRFTQAHQNGQGIVLKAPPDPKPIYNRIRVAAVEDVVVVEGEKCVHALHGVGIVATTSPGGANTPHKADWTPLAGKRVTLWPDNDENGCKYMRSVTKILEELGCSLRIVRVGDLGLLPKGDVVDYMAAIEVGKGVAVRNVLSDANSLGASREVSAMIEDTIDGKNRAIKWPWPTITRLSSALLPGTVTLICGDPGSSKSFFLLECMVHWFADSWQVALYELEEDRRYHLHRALAQLERNAHLFDNDWIEAHPDESRAASAAHAATLDGFGRCVYAAPDKQVTLDQLAEWVEARVDAGCDIIGIDPVTAAEQTAKPWVTDCEFLLRIKAAIRKTGARLILVTHPKKGRKSAVGLDELAGGAAWARFTHSVFWMERHQPPKNVSVRREFGVSAEDITRTIVIAKARNGRGAGLKVAYNFEGASLTFAELGIVSQDGT